MSVTRPFRSYDKVDEQILTLNFADRRGDVSEAISIDIAQVMTVVQGGSNEHAK